MGKRLDSRYLPGKRSPRLAQVQDARRAGVRDRRLHAGQGPARVVVRLARAGDKRPGGLSGSATSAPGSTTTRSSGCWKLRPLEREELAVPEAAEDAAHPQGRRRLGRAEARRRGLVRGVDARPPPARARLPRSARGQGRARGAARAAVPDPRIRKGKRVLRLSNLDKPFWPEEGITKGDLLAYYRDIAPVLLPHLRDRPFTLKRYPDGWQGKLLLPEGRAGGDARLDPDRRARGLDPREAAPARGRSARRS